MVWTRLLINFFGSSTYSFSIMLAAFILGITIGSWILTQASLTKFNKIKILTFSQTAIGLTTMAVLLFYEQNNASYFKELFLKQFEFAVENYFG